MDGDGQPAILGTAMRAPDDVSEIRDSEGRVAHIERHDSYPGAKRAYLDPAPPSGAIRSQWRLPATSAQPSFYPDALPFVSGLSASVMEGDTRLIATWRSDDPPRPEPEAVENLRSALPREMAEVFTPDTLGAEDSSERISRFREAFRSLRDRWTDDNVREWLVATSADDRPPDPCFLEAYQAVLTQLLARGWVHRASESEPDSVRSASLARGGRRLELRLSAPLGVGSLTLYEHES